jgi:hypothetical protein
MKSVKLALVSVLAVASIAFADDSEVAQSQENTVKPALGVSTFGVAGFGKHKPVEEWDLELGMLEQ